MAKSSELSLHGVLTNVRKRSIEKKKKDGKGFVGLSKEEQSIVQHASFEDGMGRPKKNNNDKLDVASFLFSKNEIKILSYAAKLDGFRTWKQFVKETAMQVAKKKSA